MEDGWEQRDEVKVRESIWVHYGEIALLSPLYLVMMSNLST